MSQVKQKLNRYAESIPEVYQDRRRTEDGQNFNKRSTEGQQIFILESKKKNGLYHRKVTKVSLVNQCSGF